MASQTLRKILEKLSPDAAEWAFDNPHATEFAAALVDVLTESVQAQSSVEAVKDEWVDATVIAELFNLKVSTVRGRAKRFKLIEGLEFRRGFSKPNYYFLPLWRAHEECARSGDRSRLEMARNNEIKRREKESKRRAKGLSCVS